MFSIFSLKEYLIYNIYPLLDSLKILLISYSLIMLAFCFLGRRVTITRKLVIYSLGFILFSILCFNLFDCILYQNDPILYKRVVYGLATRSQEMLFDLHSRQLTHILHTFNYLYFFFFYLGVYKEHKTLYSIESCVFLFVYNHYLDEIISFTYIYFNGGNWKLAEEVMGGYGASIVQLQNTTYLITPLITIIISLILLVGYFRKGTHYVLGLRSRIIFLLWAFFFMKIQQIPFYFGGSNANLRYKYLCNLFGMIVPFLGSVVPIIVILNAAKRSLKDQNAFQQRYLSAELEYIERYKSAQTQTRAFRHDIINNLSLTSMLMEDGKIDDAKEHLKELLGSVQNLAPQYVTGDEMLDCIISMKAEKMQSMGISFSSDGVLDGGLHMKPMDICSIFANALDNAIEAAANTEKPNISMTIKRTPQFFIINVENSASQEIDTGILLSTEYYTTKQDKEHHGFGLNNIRNTVEHLNGIIKAQSTKDSFVLSIMLPRKSDENKS